MTCCIWMYVTVHCDFAPMEKFLNENWQLIIVNNVPPLRLPTTNGCQTQISWERNYVSMVITKISFYCKKDTNSHSVKQHYESKPGLFCQFTRISLVTFQFHSKMLSWRLERDCDPKWMNADFRAFILLRWM